MPIVRTFITVVAGVSKMDRRRFFTWSGVGAVLWVGLIVGAGALLGNVAFVRDNLETAILIIVAFSVLPMIVEYIRHRRQAEAIIDETTNAARDIVTGDHKN